MMVIIAIRNIPKKAINKSPESISTINIEDIANSAKTNETGSNISLR